MMDAAGLLEHRDKSIEHVLGTPATVKVLDCFLRKSYHGLTVNMLGGLTGESKTAIKESINAIESAGLLREPDEHPSEHDIIRDGAVEPDEDAYVINTNDDVARSFAAVQTELFGVEI